MNPRYPVYIVSKGRAKSRKTSKALEAMGVPYSIVVEPQEYDEYAAVIDPAKILVLPFSNLGQGSIPARNWIWGHAIGTGAKRHWILDDNISGFYRYNHNKTHPVTSGTIFAVAEKFVDRYTNVSLAGFHYEMFCHWTEGRGKEKPAFYLNTRVYSCLLIDNAIPERWRGRYNEDTDLSLRVLKAGRCTVLFCAFCCAKAATMTMKGGNTDELYQGDGRQKMADSLLEQHPDVVSVITRWNRPQHFVNYAPFKGNRLIRHPDADFSGGADEHGMALRDGRWVDE